MKEISVKPLTKETVEECIENIPILVDEDVVSPLLKRFNYLINKIKTIE